MNSYKLELKEKEIIEFEKKKMVEAFEIIIGKNKNLKQIDKYQFRSFLKDYELNKINHLTLEQRGLIVKNFYKHFKMPFFNADFKNLELNTKLIVNEAIPIILNKDEIPKSEITKAITTALDDVIEKNFSFKEKGEKILIKQVSFRNIFEHFLPELQAAPDNALFIK